jgi:hypothetical protein
MMFAADPYVMLMASLPALGKLLSDSEPPINRERLNERLKMLSPEDFAEIDALISIVAWPRIGRDETDAEFVSRAGRVISSVRSPVLRALARERLEIRTVMAALRRRHAGEDAPGESELWGFGRHVRTIRTHWSVPDFGLSSSYPWIGAARERLEAGDVAELERIALEAAWNFGARAALEHHFDLEAVALYLLRWSLAERWARYDAGLAAARFAALLEAAVADQSDITEAAA